MQKVLVTGSSGFIGSKVVIRLRQKGYAVFTLDLLPGDENHFALDIASPEIANVFSKLKPDCVIHLAAQIDVTQSFLDPVNDLQINGFGTLNLLLNSLENSCDNFIYVHSGGAIYDSKNMLPITENGIELPVSPYGLSKQIAEGYVRTLSKQYGLGWTSLALSNCYGNLKENRKGVIYEFAMKIINQEQAKINGADVTRDFIHVDDVVSAIVLAVSRPLNQRINISSGTETSLIFLYQKIASLLGSSIEPIIQPIRNGDVIHSSLANAKARELLKWSPAVDLDIGLASSIANR